MTPADYLRTIVLPSLGDLLAEPDSQRRAYVACITAAHLVDHVAVARGIAGHRKHDVREAVRVVGPYSAACLALVEGVCTGVKHAAPDPKPNRTVKFSPGREQTRPAFALDVQGAGLDEGRLGKPGVAVEHDGRLWFLDDCALAVVRAYTLAFSDLFDVIDLGPFARGVAFAAALDCAPPTSPQAGL